MSTTNGTAEAVDPAAAEIHEALRRWRRTDSPRQLRQRLTRAKRAAETILYAERTSTADRLKACSVIIQATHADLKAVEQLELRGELERMEKAMEAAGWL